REGATDARCEIADGEVRGYGSRSAGLRVTKCGVADDASGLFSKLIYNHNVTKNKRDYQRLLPFPYPELTLSLQRKEHELQADNAK
ncbi:hypothetical protein, partial [Bacteroides heparinolyticus]|uniref:hypothetical protein n=1 Tax=Prevotella heparinolytica TaxID=28113 RepID=UPI0035A1CE72